MAAATFLLIARPPVAEQPPALPALKIAVAYAPKTLDPAYATDAAGARLLQLTNPALLRWNDHYQPVGHAAESCAQAGATITCALPRGQTFSDGTPLTAAGLKGWFDALRTNKKSPLSGPLENIRSIAAPNPATLVFTLKAPTLDMLPTLVDIPLAPSPTDPSATGPRPGLGAYRLKALDDAGNVVLTRIPTLNRGLPDLQFLYVQDPTTRLLKLKKGEVDVVFGDLPPELYRWAAAQGWPHVDAPSSAYSYLAVNFRNDFLKRQGVRQGIAMALNRPAIRKYLLGGQAEAATSLLPPGHPAAWAAPEEPHADEFAIAETLDAADTFGDVTNPRFTLQLLTSTDPLSQRIAQVIQQQLAEAGIAVELKPMEWGAFYDAVRQGRFDLALLSWTGEQRPDFLYRVFNGRQAPPAGLNRGRVDIPELDAATLAIVSATTVASQTEAAIAVQKLQAQYLPYIPLYRRHGVLVARPGVTGCAIPLAGGYQGLLSCKKEGRP